MMKIIAELDFENLDAEWSIRPVIWVDKDDKPAVIIQLFHACPTDKKLENCGLVNRDEFLAGEMPQYDCNHCEVSAPDFIVEEKLLAHDKYRGYDPRNNRRAAVLATKRKGTENVRN
jgi:hypothetical protein